MSAGRRAVHAPSLDVLGADRLPGALSIFKTDTATHAADRWYRVLCTAAVIWVSAHTHAGTLSAEHASPRTKVDAQATPVERPPRLDGTLDDPLWQSAPPISDFLQQEPHEGQAPTEQTEVRILYTR
ncbi:MAG TPA: hypothetical protein VFO44_01105, partial [Steroidobacteraceae bacterium]|nr:hypothetical protein [Steroidobacteraceae bacterium]